MVEHVTDTDGVPGSNPGARTKIKEPHLGFFYFGARGDRAIDLSQGFVLQEYFYFDKSKYVKAGAGTMWSEANMVARRGRGNFRRKLSVTESNSTSLPASSATPFSQ